MNFVSDIVSTTQCSLSHHLSTRFDAPSDPPPQFTRRGSFSWVAPTQQSFNADLNSVLASHEGATRLLPAVQGHPRSAAPSALRNFATRSTLIRRQEFSEHAVRTAIRRPNPRASADKALGGTPPASKRQSAPGCQSSSAPLQPEVQPNDGEHHGGLLS